jgi:hypothetical protein
MAILLIVLRGYVIFVAASGFIFGQLFFNYFTWGATLAGVFGIISGFFGGKFSHKKLLRSKTIIACCILSLSGVTLDPYNYYAKLNIPGNYYAWFIIAPFCLILLLIIWHIINNMPSNNELKRDA